MRVNKNDFWRGLYLLSVAVETCLHRFSIWTFRKVNYKRTLDDEVASSRHRWRKPR